MSREIDQMWRELRQLEAQEARAREARAQDRERIAALERDDATAAMGSEQTSTAPEPVADRYPARTTPPDEQEFEVGSDFESPPDEEEVVEEEGGPEAIMKTIFTILVILFLAASYLSELLG